MICNRKGSNWNILLVSHSVNAFRQSIYDAIVSCFENFAGVQIETYFTTIDVNALNNKSLRVKKIEKVEVKLFHFV